MTTNKLTYKFFGLLFFSLVFVFGLLLTETVKAEDYQCCIYETDVCAYLGTIHGVNFGTCQKGATENYCNRYLYNIIGELFCEDTLQGGEFNGEVLKEVFCFADNKCFNEVPGYWAGGINWTVENDGNVQISSDETKNIILNAEPVNKQDNGIISFVCIGCNDGIQFVSDGNTVTLSLSGTMIGANNERTVTIIGKTSKNVVSIKMVKIKVLNASAAPVASATKGALGCYCKVDSKTEKEIIVGLIIKAKCMRSQIFEEKNLTECEWNASGEQEIEVISKDVDVSVLNKLGTTDVKIIIGRIIKTGMGIIGSIALAMFVYGGLIWMLGSTDVAGGATKHDVMKAKAILVWSSLGVIVILASYALVQFVFSAF